MCITHKTIFAKMRRRSSRSDSSQLPKFLWQWNCLRPTVFNLLAENWWPLNCGHSRLLWRKLDKYSSQQFEYDCGLRFFLSVQLKYWQARAEFVRSSIFTMKRFRIPLVPRGNCLTDPASRENLAICFAVTSGWIAPPIVVVWLLCIRNDWQIGMSGGLSWNHNFYLKWKMSRLYSTGK